MKITFLGLGLALRKFIKEMKENGTLDASCVFFTYKEFEEDFEKIENKTDVFIFCINSTFFIKKDYYLKFIKKYSSKLGKEVVLFTEHANKYRDLTFYAMQKGAVDFVKVPQKLDLFSKKNFQSRFQEVYMFIKSFRKDDDKTENEKFNDGIDDFLLRKVNEPVICIGVSTGGPKVLSELFSCLSKEFKYPIIIAQHMPANYTEGFIDFMKNSYDMNFVEILNGEKVVKGKIYIVPGGQHVSITERQRFKYVNEETVSTGYRPSIDMLFSSAGTVYMENCIAILLTGIGEDGVIGLKKVKSFGGVTIVQDKETSVVFGMPQAAIRENAVDKVLSILSIGEQLNKLI
ncbi:chemotaxis protein CheB [bacterium]|nr:chemotaxis protein CheB [bacterium]